LQRTKRFGELKIFTKLIFFGKRRNHSSLLVK
jgi:hypothetical protein